MRTAALLVLAWTLRAVTAPAQDDAALRQAQVLLRAGRADVAAERLKTWCEAGELPERWLAASRLLLSVRLYAAADPFTRRALELAPQLAEAHALRGTCLLLSGETAAAREVFAGSVQRFPEDAGLHFQLGMAYAHNQELLAAAGAFEAALERSPEDAIAQFWAGDNYLRLNDLTAAERHLREAARQPKVLPDAGWKLAEVLAHQGRHEAAEKQFRRSLAAVAGRSRLRAAFHFGVFLFEQQRLEEARPLLVQVTREWPEHRTCWSFLARCERRLGNAEAAAVALARYQELQRHEDSLEEETLLAQIGLARGSR